MKSGGNASAIPSTGLGGSGLRQTLFAPACLQSVEVGNSAVILVSLPWASAVPVSARPRTRPNSAPAPTDICLSAATLGVSWSDPCIGCSLFRLATDAQAHELRRNEHVQLRRDFHL